MTSDQDDFVSSMRQRIEKGDIRTTEQLIKAFNKNPRDRFLNDWCSQYVVWFNQTSVTSFQKNDFEEMIALGRLKADTENKKELLVQKYFSSLCKKASEASYGQSELMKYLNVVLQTIAPEAFNKNTIHLTQLAGDLLKKVDKTKAECTEENFPSFEPILYALNSTFNLIYIINKDADWNMSDPNGLYKKFERTLKKLKSKKTYYPYSFQSNLVLKNLKRLGDPSTDMQQALIIARNIGKLAFHLYEGIHSIFIRADLDQLVKAGASVREFFKSLTENEEVKKFVKECFQSILAWCRQTIKKLTEEGKFGWYEVVARIGDSVLFNPNEEGRFGSLLWIKELVEDKLLTGDSDILKLLVDKVGPLVSDISLGSAAVELLKTLGEKIVPGSSSKEKPRPLKDKEKDVAAEIERYMISATERTQRVQSIPIPSEPVFDKVIRQMSEKIGHKIVFPMDRRSATKRLKANYQEYYSTLDELLNGSQVPTGKAQFRLGLVTEKNKTMKPIKLAELFGSMEIKVQNRPIHKVLLTGQVGIGKTSLCQRLAYEWANDRLPAWEAVYLLPRNEFTEDEQQPQVLAQDIARVCFASSPKEHRYLELVKQIEEQLESEKTLLIFDGELGDNKWLLEIAQQVKSKLLITSHSYRVEDFNLEVDRIVEILELTPESVEAHVRNYMNSNEKEARKLLTFLKVNEAFEPIVKIPVTLNILCALWLKQPEKLKMSAADISGLYQEFSYYILDAYKERHKDEVYEADEKVMNELGKILGQIALATMKTGETFINDEIEKEILERRADQQMQDIILDGRFLKTEGQRTMFLNMTFRNFFAGKELASQLVSTTAAAKTQDFLKLHKYDSRYREAFTVMTGEICKNQELQGLLNVLQSLDDSEEMLGVQHTFLQLRCINQWLNVENENLESLLLLLKNRFDFFAALAKWQEAEVKGATTADLVVHNILLREFPSVGSLLLLTKGHEPYIKMLKNSQQNKHLRQCAKESLQAIARAGPREANVVIKSLGILMSDDKQFEVRSAAVEILASVVKVAPGNAKLILPFLQRELQGNDELLRAKAAAALLEVAKAAPNEAYTATKTLRRMLATDDTSSEVKISAALALGALVIAIPEEATSVSPVLLTSLQDKHYQVREASARALRAVAKAAHNKATGLLQPLTNALADPVTKVRCAAAEALGVVMQAVCREADAVFDRLEAEIWHDNPNIRRNAVWTLGALIKAVPEEASVVFPAIQAAFKDEDASIRCYVVESLSFAIKAIPQKAGAIFEILETAIEDENLKLRCYAVKTLKLVVKGCPKDAQVILDSLQQAVGDKNEDLYVQLGAAKAIIEILKAVPERVTEVIGNLKIQLGVGNKNIRHITANVLVDITKFVPKKGDEIVEIFKASMRNKVLTIEVRQTSVRAFGVLAIAVPKKAGEVLGILKDTLGEEDLDKEIRCYAIEAMVEVVKASPEKARGVLETLENILSTKGGEIKIKYFAAWAIGLILQLSPHDSVVTLSSLQAKLDEDKTYTLAMLSLGSNATTAPNYEKTLQIPDISFEMLEHEIQKDENKDLISIVHNVSDVARKVLVSLESVLKDEDKEARRAAAKAIGAVIKAFPEKRKMVIDKLQSSLANKNSHTDVRAYSAEALAIVLKAVPGNTKSVIESLFVVLMGDDLIVARSAAQALTEVGTSGPVEAQQVLTLLAKAQAEVNESDVVASVTRAIIDVSKAMPKQAVAVLETLKSFLRIDDVGVRDSATSAFISIAKVVPHKADAIFESLKFVLNDIDVSTLELFPTKQLVEYFLEYAEIKALAEILKQKFYGEAFVIQDLEAKKCRITLYPDSGHWETWIISEVQGKQFRSLCT